MGISPVSRAPRKLRVAGPPSLYSRGSGNAALPPYLVEAGIRDAFIQGVYEITWRDLRFGLSTVFVVLFFSLDARAMEYCAFESGIVDLLGQGCFTKGVGMKGDFKVTALFDIGRWACMVRAGMV
ncbi:hypothetical protein KM043_016987 [Ampulex compressa]|nr:hypothetical protein KM043_016987 [Ampulex compressa]